MEAAAEVGVDSGGSGGGVAGSGGSKETPKLRLCIADKFFFDAL